MRPLIATSGLPDLTTGGRVAGTGVGRAVTPRGTARHGGSLPPPGRAVAAALQRVVVAFRQTAVPSLSVVASIHFLPSGLT